jgi:multidrug efflux pump subunit AcrA (membrane-fusion protein)
MMSVKMTGSKMRKPALRVRRMAACASVTAILAALGPLAGCRKETTPETEVTVQAAHPEQGPIADQVVADAVLTPVAQAAIEPKITAPVKKFYVQRGARVKAGELLATLENNDLAGAAMDSKGAYAAAQAAYATATRAQVPEDMLRAQSDLAQAKANLDLNRSIVNNRKQLFAQGAIPGRDLDTAQAVLVQAQAAYDAAASHLKSLRSVSRAAALQAAQGNLTSAEGRYQDAEAQLNYSEIRSPIDGVVTDRPLFAGETASAGAPLITVMDTSILIAKAHIAQSLAQQLKLGNTAQVLVPGIANPVAATVSLISPALDAGSTTVEIWVKIVNRSGALKAGTPVKVSISGDRVADAWKIPNSAVLTANDGSQSVMVVGADGAAQRRPVTLGIRNGREAQVLSGLAPSDLVITGGAYGLDEGTKVKVGPAGIGAARSDAVDGGPN